MRICIVILPMAEQSSKKVRTSVVLLDPSMRWLCRQLGMPRPTTGCRGTKARKARASTISPSAGHQMWVHPKLEWQWVAWVACFQIQVFVGWASNERLKRNTGTRVAAFLAFFRSSAFTHKTHAVDGEPDWEITRWFWKAHSTELFLIGRYNRADCEGP